MSALGYFRRVRTDGALPGVDVRASFERRDGHAPKVKPAPPPKPVRTGPAPKWGPDGCDKRWLLVKGERCIMCDRAQCGRGNERLFRGVCMRCRSSHDQRAIGWAIKRHEEKRA